MDGKCLTGCGTAMFTPFQDGKVDVPSLIRQTREQVEAGMDFLVPLGTTGETPTLSDEEKLLVFRTVKAHSGNLPVMVGVGTNSFEGTLSNMRLLAEADAYLVVVPYYNKPPQRGLLAYFQGLAAETDKPIVLYNVPGRTGTNLEAGTTLALSRPKNIIGIKEASGRRDQILEILEGAPEDFAVLSGNDDDTLFLMEHGADGVVSVASNLAPALMVRFVQALRQGDFATARSLEERLSPLFRDLFVEPNPIPGKAGMALLGRMEDDLRLPLVSALPATRELIEKDLEDLDLL